MSYHLIEKHRCFEGTQNVYNHWSEAINAEMRFALFLPQLKKREKAAVLYWLSGLTCSEQNFITKAGAQRMAAQLGIALVVPDTSPRNIPNMPNQDYLGEGASFYCDAIQGPWSAHYQMYTYISQELPNFINSNFPIDQNRCGIFGHSMGGHGALVIGLKNPKIFQSISAFAPISSLIRSPWGLQALTNYLGSNKEVWNEYDACYLLKKYPWKRNEILIDQGTEDPFLKEQLKPNLLVEAAEKKSLVTLRFQSGYDHSYYFVSSFIEEHLRFHLKSWV
jgi:S-formylglutathione hydrolase